jgi:hypothetical protein
MPPLSAAQVENAVVRLEAGRADENVDFLNGVLPILNDVAIGLEIDGVEQRPPPVGGEMPLQIGNGPECADAVGFGERGFSGLLGFGCEMGFAVGQRPFDATVARIHR